MTILDKNISRRDFLKGIPRAALILSGAGAALSCSSWGGTWLNEASAGLFSSVSDDLIQSAPVARYWISANAPGVSCLACHKPADKIQNAGEYHHKEGFVKCLLCAQECLIKPGERGNCRARLNVGGTLRSLVYGRPVTVHVDPIEKKPFYHYLPGASAFSLATAGCPLHCKFCQNWEISQARPEDFAGKSGQYTPPGAIVQAAAQNKAPVIAFTYNEPTVFAEYLTDIARLARKQDIRNVLISCGFMNQAPLDEMCDVLDAIKIDLKGFSKAFYRDVCSAELDPVLRSIKHIAKRGVHLEIVNLVVPTLNDSKQMLTELAKWVTGELGPDVPVHFTRFHPDYQMLNLPPTPIASLEQAYEIAKTQGIRYAFVGNVPGHPGNHTYCPSCGKAVILRTGFFVTAAHLKDGRCEYCNARIAGVWS